MSIELEPTKIKQTFYLLIPKSVADLANISDKTRFSLKIRNEGSKQVLEYQIGDKK